MEEEDSPDSLQFHLSDDDENSNDCLQIVVESPESKKASACPLSEDDNDVIARVEEELEELLEEKAAKANLTAINVKNILKQVLTNKDVLALVRQAENPEECTEPVTYEPRFTRAKTKQLLAENGHPEVISWAPTAPKTSAVRRLINEELQDESDDDEYVPGLNENIEDDLNTTGKSAEDDEEAEADDEEEEEEMAQDEVEDEEEEEGIEETREMEIDCTSAEMSNNELNIALRTRSKLCLSDTPLEEIETSFMPPDITCDMYDMNCDDDVWRDFLKTFTKPLDEVTKAPEDEDHDPEYNILADEEIDKVDKEELRADRAVTISRKELTNLMAELFEYTDIYNSNKSKEKEQNQRIHNSSNMSNKSIPDTVQPVVEDDGTIKADQLLLLAQQLRQHVQMLTQTFLLTYRHPEFGDYAPVMKSNLLELNEQSQEKIDSVFNITNLSPAILLIKEWEDFFASNSLDTLKYIVHVEKVIVETQQAKSCKSDYVPTFPQHLLETVSRSEVFLYPNLLPLIPFKPSSVTARKLYFFTASEDSLLAFLLEKLESEVKPGKKRNLPAMCYTITRDYIQGITYTRLQAHIIQKSREPGDNPIKYYSINGKCLPFVHYVIPPETLLPPDKVSPELLPYQWRKFIHPNILDHEIRPNIKTFNSIPILVNPVVLAVQNSYSLRAPKSKPRLILPNPEPFFVLNNHMPELRTRKTKRNTPLPSIEVKLERPSIVPVQNNCANMLPDMPNLGGTPIKNTDTSRQQDTDEQNEKRPATESVKRNFQGLSDFLVDRNDCTTKTTSNECQKDNPDEINDLMVACTTVKSAKKEPSGAEKKRMKIKKDYLANVAMATPDDAATKQQKSDNFAGAYFEKLRETLSEDDYTKLIKIMTEFDVKTTNFVDFYKEVQSVLRPKYRELSEEFVLFLTDIQAHCVGQLPEFITMKDKDGFMKNLHSFFKDQPAQLKKVFKAFTDLSENPDTNLDDIKKTVLPLLKGNSILTDMFLKIFPMEKPPKLLTERPCEVMDLRTELSRVPEEEICETISVPDTEDPYGGPNCICTCHSVDNAQFSSRSSHCTKCGLKFIQGKVYVQAGKLLRPAVVSFLTNPEVDHTERLSGNKAKVADISPNKVAPSTSPRDTAHLHEDSRISNESDEECDRRKGPQKRKRSQCKKKSKDATKSNSRNARAPRKRKTDMVTNENDCKPGSSEGQQKRLQPESEDRVDSTELIELKISPDPSGESENEMFESSQDNVTNTESDESSIEIQQWSRDEDKIILQEFQQSNDREQTFRKISKLLPNRQIADIKNRFYRLMSLLQEMATTATV